MPCDSINAITRAWQCACGNDRCRGIISHLAQTDVNKEGSTIPLIGNLEMTEIFKDEDKEKETSIIDFIR